MHIGWVYVGSGLFLALDLRTPTARVHHGSVRKGVGAVRSWSMELQNQKSVLEPWLLSGTLGAESKVLSGTLGDGAQFVTAVWNLGRCLGYSSVSHLGTWLVLICLRFTFCGSPGREADLTYIVVEYEMDFNPRQLLHF